MSEEQPRPKHSVMKICKFCDRLQGIAKPVCECGNDKFWRQRDVS